MKRPNMIATNAASAPPTQLRRAVFNGWAWGTLAVALLIALPILWIIGLALAPSDGMWKHLVDTVLARLIWTTLLLITGVGLGTFIIGTGTAWVVTMCRFPGRRLFEWALLIPMAVPAYVIAYVYTDLLEYAGPIQGLIRDLGGFQTRHDYSFPDIRSLGGAIAMMTLVLYPYVYLMARSAFLAQSVCVLEASRTLGCGPWRSFFKVALPLARPAIAVGVSLVMMETLNDYGTVDFFAVATFTTAIFDVWLNMNSASGAAQLATVLLAFVIILVSLERYQRRQQKFHHTSSPVKAISGYHLRPLAAFGAFCACALPVGLGFVVPAAILGDYALNIHNNALNANFLSTTANSFMVSGAAALIATVLGVFLAYSLRLGRAPWLGVIARLATMGYAVSGAILAIGILLLFGFVDNTLDGFARHTFGLSTGLLFSGTSFAVIFGYVVRFLSLSFGTVEAGLSKVTQAMDGAARTLGAGPLETLRRVHLPMLKGSILTAVLLVFVDGMKELPMTTILRPFDFETLATFVHQYASDERLPEASLAALTIVAAGIIPVLILSRTITKSRVSHTVIKEP